MKPLIDVKILRVYLGETAQQDGKPLNELLVNAARKRAAPEALTGAARDVMKTEVFTVRPDTSVADVVRFLVEKMAKRLVVADDAGRLLGMVDRDRLLCALGNER